VIFKGQVKEMIGGADFATALFAIWFGADPADEGLKDSLVGRSDVMPLEAASSVIENRHRRRHSCVSH
jgi:hypothetical protein